MSLPTASTNIRETARRTPKQQNSRGCCCKRSQCIKNYCDCYQSMTTCSIYCKCIGCRNTEERLEVVTPPPKKSALIAKREQAVALSAKAVAAAARDGNSIHLKPAPGSAVYAATQQFSAQMQNVIIPQKPQVPMQLSDANLENVIMLPPPNAGGLTKKPTLAVPPSPTLTPRDVNLFNPNINAAILECVVVQAAEAEEMGFNVNQVNKVVFHEFTRCLQSFLKVYQS